MSKPGVLIVEDEAITALEIRKVVESSDYEVLGIVHSGEEAIKEAITLQPDLILMDIILQGDMDGVDAARKIKEFTDIPVLYLTALESVEPNRLKNTKGTGYLVKPISEGELKSNIEIALHNYQNSKKEIEDSTLNSLNDVQVFMQSIIPQLSSDLSIDKRGTFLGKFHRKFEKFMKPKFLRETGRFDKGVFDKLPENGKLQVYLSWINNFFLNLGFEVHLLSEGDSWIITLKNCIWCEKNYENIVYCLICQAILKQTLSWTNIDGYIQSLSDATHSKSLCRYKIGLNQ
jgi:two-component system, response regulator PdtaR